MMTMEAAPNETFDLSTDLPDMLTRQLLRVPFSGQIRYRQGDYIEGRAYAEHLGKGKIGMRLTRFLAPEEDVELELNCVTFQGLPVTVRGRVEWCRRAFDGRSFNCLVRMRRQR